MKMKANDNPPVGDAQLVSLKDVEEAIVTQMVEFEGYEAGPSSALAQRVRNRLAKPAERVTWSQLSNGNALVRLDGNDVAIFYRGPFDHKHADECAERYAAELREQLRAVKQ